MSKVNFQHFEAFFVLDDELCHVHIVKLRVSMGIVACIGFVILGSTIPVVVLVYFHSWSIVIHTIHG